MTIASNLIPILPTRVGLLFALKYPSSQGGWVSTIRYSFYAVANVTPVAVTVTVTVPLDGILSVLVFLPAISTSDNHPVVCWHRVTDFDALVGSPVAGVSVTPSFASPVSNDAEHSAYALLRLARSVASLAFSSCDVKIGMLIATKTPMIATYLSSSARRNVVV